ncbi:MAG: ABC transporter ATP-binding protein [Candidatus Latescibacteria bacterium]|nr:ABC transporter ATP-binding protein [Candidatus Latescibacterota bacterium]
MNFLEIKGLCRNFGGLRAVCDLNAHIEAGRITAMIGPNGAGKTTAFNLVTGLLPVSTGKIFFQGKDITGLPPHKIAFLGVARTFQNIRIFSNMSVLENVMVGVHTRSCKGMFSSALRLPGVSSEEKFIRDEAFKYLEWMELAHLASMDAGNLPFGQQRILEIARALAAKPKLILLDEPAAGLNSQETNKLSKLIRNILESGVTVFLVEHDMELVMNISHDIIVLNNGFLITRGTPSEVQRNKDVITAYLGEEH